MNSKSASLLGLLFNGNVAKVRTLSSMMKNCYEKPHIAPEYLWSSVYVCIQYFAVECQAKLLAALSRKLNRTRNDTILKRFSSACVSKRLHWAYI